MSDFTCDWTGELLAAAAGGGRRDRTGLDRGTHSCLRPGACTRRQRQCTRRTGGCADAKAASDGYEVWVAARADNDFAAFAPALERNFELTRDYIACFDGYDDPYDVVLDDFAPGMRTAQVTRAARRDAGPADSADRALSGREIDVAPLHVALSGRWAEAARRQGPALDGVHDDQLAAGRHRASVRGELRRSPISG